MGVKRRKKKSNGEGAGGGWEVVYSGFVLILLCFFIMMCSFATMETSKVTRFVKSFSLAVSIFTGGLNFDEGDIILPVSQDIVAADSPISNIFHEMRKIMDEFGVDKDVVFAGVEGGFVLRLADTVLFDLGKGEINKNAIPMLSKIASVLSRSENLIRIEGHTDDLPINTAMFPSNWELSTTRAISVLRYFIEQENISSERLSAEGFGEYRPIYENDSQKNRAKNRRVEIKIYEKKLTGSYRMY